MTTKTKTFKVSKPWRTSKDRAGTTTIANRIRDIRRSLFRENSSIPMNVRETLERELASLQRERAIATAELNRYATMAKYKRPKFFGMS
jgi:hypothetical protein